MEEVLPHHAQLLKSQLNKALQMHYDGLEELLTIYPGMPRCEETLMVITSTMKK